MKSKRIQKKKKGKKIYKKISGPAATLVVISDAVLWRVRNSLEI